VGRFSDRHGLGPPKDLQLDLVNEELRTRLWNILTLGVWDKLKSSYYSYEFERLLWRVWLVHLNWHLDDYRKLATTTILSMIKEFFFDCVWYEVYDLLEFVVDEYPEYPAAQDKHDSLILMLNRALEEELAAYRVVANKIAPITSQVEVAEVEAALETPQDAVRIHLETALAKLSEKPTPDYRNCIKEAISAVESTCNLIKGGKRARGLGQCLGQLRQQGVLSLHGALAEGFAKLFGWTSDAEGIRHGLMDLPDLGREEAVFMLVACSAFVNYLLAKSEKE